MREKINCRECIERVYRDNILEHYRENHPASQLLKEAEANIQATCNMCDDKIQRVEATTDADGRVFVPAYCRECISDPLMELMVNEHVE